MRNVKTSYAFFKEVPPPHTSVYVRNNFEDQLDHLNVTSFVVVIDNTANMKCAFHMAADDNDDTPEFDDSSSDMHEDDEDKFVESLEGWTVWTVTPIHGRMWSSQASAGCAHGIQRTVGL